MSKILRQNVDGTEFTMAGCALTGVCASSASDYVKVITLSDGDELSDGMMTVITFANGNTAGNAPNAQTIYSSDQVHYYSDSGMTVAFTLAPQGCYDLVYSGSGNAYSYTSYPVITVGGITAPICDSCGKKTSGALWNAGDSIAVLYTMEKFLLLAVKAFDAVVDGSMRPITSNAVAKGTIQYLDWAAYSGTTLGEVIVNAMNSLPIIYNTKNNVYSFRGTWSGNGYFQALVSNPRTINNYKFNVFVQFSTASASMSNPANGDYIIQVLYNENNTPRFSLLNEQKVIAESSTETYLRVVDSTSVSVTIDANTGQSVSIPFEIPSGYKALGYVGMVTSGATGAINWYSYAATNIAGRTGTFSQSIYFRNYTDTQQTAVIKVSVLCCKV